MGRLNFLATLYNFTKHIDDIADSEAVNVEQTFRYPSAAITSNLTWAFLVRGSRKNGYQQTRVRSRFDLAGWLIQSLRDNRSGEHAEIDIATHFTFIWLGMI